MKKTKKHAAPLRCYIEVWLRGMSPSCSIKCDIGARGCRRCKGCMKNKRERINAYIAEAFEQVAEQAGVTARALESTKTALTFSSRQPKKHDGYRIDYVIYDEKETER